MTIDTENLLHSILEGLDKLEYVKSADIPNIDLYMDQVTTFMDNRLRNLARNPGVDKVMTKTMINNYAKNDLLPPPVKKKYSKEHVLLLFFIYYYKNVLSISDIQTLLNPITEKYFQNDKEFSLEKIYQEVFSMEKDEIEALKRDVEDKFAKAQSTFDQAEEEDQEFLQIFAFICLLSYDVYIKKMIIEKMVDDISERRKSGDGKNKEPKK
ncbi:MAG: DUF1836 domain-containing protein [Lachnospiraceae bacterium]|nr:DUF1836 domain-containing protein [Lachnospiraceae bacterium]